MGSKAKNGNQERYVWMKTSGEEKGAEANHFEKKGELITIPRTKAAVCRRADCTKEVRM